MRRSRHKLEVSTFPFLAVLLCAMGAIFLLIVMDRRAKIVARHKLEEKRLQEAEARDQAHATARAERAQREGKRALALVNRQAEWEKERDRLHRMLLEQERELRSQLAGMTKEIDITTREVQKRDAYVEAVKGYLTVENVRLLREYQELSRKKEQAGLSGQQGEAVKSDLQRLTIDVLRMERTLKELRDLKSRPSDTYSLIPYSGKYGDKRNPVYVECSAAGLTLHPNRTFLSNYGLSGARFLQEVEARAGMLEVQKKVDPTALSGVSTSNPNAYVLFLVRPDGIMNYHHAEQVLDKYAIDYGYELVEPNWVFNFANEDLAAQQPWQQGSGKSRMATGVRNSVGGATVGLVGPPGSSFAGGSLPGPPGSSIGSASGLPGPPGSSLAFPGVLPGPPGFGSSIASASGLPGPPGSGIAGGNGSSSARLGAVGSARGYASGAPETTGQSGFRGLPGGGPSSSGSPAGSGPPGFGVPGPGALQGGELGGSGTGPGGSMAGYRYMPPPPTYIVPDWMLYLPTDSTKGTAKPGFACAGGYGLPNAGIVASIMPSLLTASSGSPSGPANAGLMASLLPTAAPASSPFARGGFGTSFGGGSGAGVAGGLPPGYAPFSFQGQGGNPGATYAAAGNAATGYGTPGSGNMRPGATGSAGGGPGYSSAGNPGSGNSGQGNMAPGSPGNGNAQGNVAMASGNPPSMGPGAAGPGNLGPGTPGAGTGPPGAASSPSGPTSSSRAGGNPASAQTGGAGNVPGSAYPQGDPGSFVPDPGQRPPDVWQSGSGGGGGGSGGGASGPSGGAASGSAAGSSANSPAVGGGDPGALPSTKQPPPGTPPGKSPPGEYGPVNAGQPASSWSGFAAGDPGSRPRSPPTPTQLRANHDFIINLVCWDYGVVLASTNKLYPMNPPETQEAARTALVQTIQTMIARRQATVREGEPPYQPMINLVIRPEGGLRGYYWVLPALHALHVPMSRENPAN